MAPPRLLIARAEPEASFTAALVTQLGGEPILAPTRRVIAIETPAPQKPVAIVATSARAFELGAEIPSDWRDLPCLVVGEITGEAAQKAGFRDIRIAQGEAAGLARPLVNFRGKPVVYLAGEPRRPELADDALEHGIQLVPWVRYRMENAEDLPEPARAALENASCDAILHFSRESVASLLQLVTKAGLQAALARPFHACLSPAIAESLRQTVESQRLASGIVIAPARNAKTLIETALRACRRDISP